MPHRTNIAKRIEVHRRSGYGVFTAVWAAAAAVAAKVAGYGDVAAGAALAALLAALVTIAYVNRNLEYVDR